MRDSVVGKGGDHGLVSGGSVGQDQWGVEQVGQLFGFVVDGGQVRSVGGGGHGDDHARAGRHLNDVLVGAGMLQSAQGDGVRGDGSV